MVESGKASGHKADTSLARPHGSPSDTPWHTRDASEVLSALGVDTSTGLSTAQAAERRQQFGPNAMAAGAVESRLHAFLRQYADHRFPGPRRARRTTVHNTLRTDSVIVGGARNVLTCCGPAGRRDPRRSTRRHPRTPAGDRSDRREHHRRRHLQPAGLAVRVWADHAVVDGAGHGVGALALALLFAGLSRRLPADGGPYAYSRVAFGNGVGFTNAWSYWITAWAGNAAIVTGWVLYVEYLLTQGGQQSPLAKVARSRSRWSACGSRR